MKPFLKYIANWGWNLAEAIVTAIIKALASWLTPLITTKLHNFLADLDKKVQENIDKW